MNLEKWPKIITERLILQLPELGCAKLMCDFVVKNKTHLSCWEPVQSDIFYTESYWKEKIVQIRDDFLTKKSCCLNNYMKENDKLVGMINYNNFIHGAFHSCFLGFKISEDTQNKGLITEALRASTTYVFKQLNLHRIGANYMPRNRASAKVLEKGGFKQGGIAEDYLYINGKWEQHMLTSLINNNWNDR